MNRSEQYHGRMKLRMYDFLSYFVGLLLISNLVKSWKKRKMGGSYSGAYNVYESIKLLQMKLCLMRAFIV